MAKEKKAAVAEQDEMEKSLAELDELTKSEAVVTEPTLEDKLAETAQSLAGAVHTLVKSKETAAPLTKSEAEEETDEPAAPAAKSTASTAGEELSKSLAESREYQEVIDVTEAFAPLETALVKGFSALESLQKSDMEQVKGVLGMLVKSQHMLVKAQLALFKKIDEQPLPRPMPGQFGLIQKSRGAEKATPYTDQQIRDAVEDGATGGKIDPSWLSRMDALGSPQLLLKSMGPEDLSAIGLKAAA